MTVDSLWYVQAGLHTHLANAASLTALLPNGPESIFDHVPSGSAYPYVVMGDFDFQPIGTQGQESNEVIVDLHTYSRFLGMEETRNIMAEIRASLHRQSFEITKSELIICRFIAASTTLMNDRKTRRGLQKFQIITDDA